ncbi:MAG: beta-lactamase family protein [Saprospiraceae bacterium]|nr:beta-lactamase family protein [Saprospiraceae bacterium]
MKLKFLLLIFFISSSCLAQSGLPDSLILNIEERLKSGLSPSYAIGIIDENGPQYYLYGKKSIEGETVDKHSIYEIGSISKTFTAILLAQAVSEGKMSLDDPVQKFLPEVVSMPKLNGQEISFGHLSDHTSSLPRMPTNFTPEDPLNPFADYTVDQLYECLNDYELPRDIGSAYEYSNLAQGLLGHVLELVYDKSYEELVIERIAAPLKMNETKVTLDDNMKRNLALGYNYGMDAKNWDIPTLAGAGAIRSSVHDMLIYLAANLGLVKSDIYPSMELTHQIRHDKAGNARVGLGWHINKGAYGDVIWHNGGTGGYRTFSGFVKETGRGVVVLTNSTTGADDIGMYLLDPSSKLQVIEKKKRSIFRKKKE